MSNTSAVVGAVKWMASSLAEEGKYLYGVQDHVRDLQNVLEHMQQLVRDVDADPQLARENGQLRIFTHRIRELALRAEDVIDTYVVDVGAKIYQKNRFLKLASLVAHCYPVHMVRKEIEDIQQEIEKAGKEYQTFGITIPNMGNSHQQGNINNNNAGSASLPAENYIHLDDEVVVGIDGAISELVARLTNPKVDFKVLAVVGTGGAGKTTLAMQLYRNGKVASYFPYKAFITVSQKWSRFDLFSRICRGIAPEMAVPFSVPEIVSKLHEFMKDKQCLVILDDIWQKEALDVIYPIFHGTNKGCRVILTTRNEEVVPFDSDEKCITHRPNPLKEEEKWVLFRKIAMEGRAHIENDERFNYLGRKMLEKCGGLPLAVVALAGVLRRKQELYEWEAVSEACTNSILKAKGGRRYGVVEVMLELSYLDLPAHLKPCFMYLAIFPEDWDIFAEHLTKLWIGEGFITDELRRERETLDDVARRFVDELAQRCIIQVTKRSLLGQIEFFRLHDLMRELCVEKEKISYVMKDSSTSQQVRGPCSQPRRMTIASREHKLEENHDLRTLVYYVETPPEMLFNGEGRILEPIHDKFKLLRVLTIWGIRSAVLPKEIGNLKHLRYLGIILTKVSELPKSVRSLQNLLYLEYHYGKALEGGKIPKNLVRDMENLRELLLLPGLLPRGPYPDLNRDSFEKLGLSGSKNLLKLTSVAGKWMITELPTLSLTVQHLQVHDLRDEEQIMAIYMCPSIKEDRLVTLGCFASDSKHVTFDLGALCHCKKLQNLELACWIDIEYKSKIRFPRNLVTLHLSGSYIDEEHDLIQALGGLSHLISLSLSYKSYWGKQLNCTRTAFKQLQELELDSLFDLEEWNMEEGAMPRLTKIQIGNCEKLKRLPKRIASIRTMKMLRIKDMREGFCRRLEYGGEDYDIIKHIPSVVIVNIKS